MEIDLVEDRSNDWSGIVQRECFVCVERAIYLK
jgi:hypothetical protein